MDEVFMPLNSNRCSADNSEKHKKTDHIALTEESFFGTKEVCSFTAIRIDLLSKIMIFYLLLVSSLYCGRATAPTSRILVRSINQSQHLQIFVKPGTYFVKPGTYFVVTSVKLLRYVDVNTPTQVVMQKWETNTDTHKFLSVSTN